MKEPTQKQIHALRDFLRQPAQRATERDPISRHREALAAVWARALTLTNRDSATALALWWEAVRSMPQPVETESHTTAVVREGAWRSGVRSPEEASPRLTEASAGSSAHSPFLRMFSGPLDLEHDALAATIEGGLRITTVAERLLARAASGERLTNDERDDTASELRSARAGLEQLDAQVVWMRQKQRPM